MVTAVLVQPLAVLVVVRVYVPATVALAVELVVEPLSPNPLQL